MSRLGAKLWDQLSRPANLGFLWGVTLILLITPPMFLAALPFLPFDRQGRIAHGFSRVWARIILAGCLVFVRVYGAGNLEKGRSYVFAANHASIFDILALLAWLPARFRFVAKREAFGLPFFGFVLRRARHIPIDRLKGRRALASLDKAAALVGQGLSIVIFPEGTRTRDGSIGRFKRGGFTLAARVNGWVVPVAVSGAFRVMPPKSRLVRPGRIKIRLMPALEPAGDSRAHQAELAELVRQGVEEGFEPRFNQAAWPAWN